MSSVMDFMSKDHDRLDKIFSELGNATSVGTAKPLFHDFKIGLQRHIVWEEEVLFPAFEEKTGMHGAGPTEAMRNEHRQIKKFLESIHDHLAEGKKDTVELEKGLLEVLKPHNDKEESILYPCIDESLTEKEIEDVFASMKSLPPERYNKCCE